MWHGYFYIKINDSLSQVKLDESIAGMLEMGKQSDPQPCKITHFCSSSRHFIFELEVSSVILKAQVVTKLANKLGYTEQQVINNIDDWQVFLGNNWEERKNNARQHKIDNPLIWNI